MKSVHLTEADSRLLDLLGGVGDEPLILIKDGTPVAVLWPTPGADLETVSLSLSPHFIRIIEESRQSVACEGTLSHEEVRQRLADAPDQPALTSRVDAR